MTSHHAALGVALLVAAGVAQGEPPAYPETPRDPVTDVLQGTPVSEDYRWLEQTDAPQTRSWIDAQNRLTRATLDALPGRAALHREIVAMTGSGSASRYGFQFAAGRLYALKHQPPAAQDVLVMLNRRGDPASERVVVDPNRLDTGGTTAIDWYRVSPDGRYVAVSLSANGSEDGSLHVFRTGDGQALPDVVPRVQYPTGGGSVAWTRDGRDLYYTRYPQGSERPPEDANFYQQVWYHRLGTPPSTDRYVLGDGLPRIAEIALQASDDGRHLLADVANGDGGAHSFYLRSGGAAAPWRRIAEDADGIRVARFGRDGKLYAIALKDSPRGRIVAMPLRNASALLRGSPTVVPESDVVIEELEPTRSRLYVEVLAGGPSELRAYALDGRTLGTVRAPGSDAICDTSIGTRLAGDAILFSSRSFVTANAWYRYDGRDVRKVALSDPPTYAPDGVLHGLEAVREFAVSKDGTRVPVNIVRRIGTPLDGSQPVLLTGYGGYSLSIRPYFGRETALWLRHGGVLAVANLRGGGEFGEEWHLAGNLTRKQNVFDDFIAVAEHLVSRGYTRPDRLAIEGGSNGGLLMGAVLTQRPELFRAVVSDVGIYDMLRVELTPNGSFNVTEYGSVKDADQFRALLAYSPLHRVRDGTAYPAVLLATGEHDGRVAAWMSYKMAARLQAANPSGRPVLLRVAADAGHGMGTSLASAIDLQADELAFLMHELGMTD